MHSSARRSRIWRGCLIALLVATVATVVACGGGGGGGSTPTSPPPPTPPPPPPTGSGVSFTGTTPPPGNGVSLSEGAGTDIDTLVLQLDATSLNGVFGLSFDLVFPGNLLSFSSASEGPAFSSDGASTSFLVSDDGGRILVGLSRLDNGNFSGSGQLATFEFDVTGNGSGSIFFEREEALDSAADEVGISWSGGSVQINP